MDDIRRWRTLLSRERDAAALYERLAAAESGERRAVLGRMAAVERRHAAHWEHKLRQAGVSVTERSPVSVRSRLLGQVAGRWSPSAVLPLVERATSRDAGRYDDEPDAAAAMAAEERSHAHVLAALVHGPGTDPRVPAARRRSRRSGALRTAVFRVNSGLMSNAALILAFAGSGAARSVIRLAGVVGLLIGALMIAASEYVSASSQLAVDTPEAGQNPEGEHAELVQVYRDKGLDPAEAQQFADRLLTERRTAPDLGAAPGLDPLAVGSPAAAALSGLVAYSAGAFVVVVPYLFTAGTAALFTVVGVFATALLLLGAGIGALSGRSSLWSAGRQLLVGGLAGGVTFGVGHAIELWLI